MEVNKEKGCPTQDNYINCSECNHECKLRMQPKKDNNEAEIPPEPQQPVIYY